MTPLALLPLVLLAAPSPAPSATPGAAGKIKHVVVIFQENRSFDHYFGTFPGADGLPMKDGVFTSCLPDPESKECVRPFHDPNDSNRGGPHGADTFQAVVNGGKMDGFLREERSVRKANCKDPFDPLCVATSGPPDVMGYHDEREIPNYWAYAREYVLQDRMFASNSSWSLPAHLFLVSAWSAICSDGKDPMSCKNALQEAWTPSWWVQIGKFGRPMYAWTDITYLLHKAGVTWGYYVGEGTQPDCDVGEDEPCTVKRAQKAGTPSIWNPLPWFATVRKNHQLRNIKPVTRFYEAARKGNLPSVSWIVPSAEVSEHPPHTVSAGEAYVTGLVNAVMQGPSWDSTAIFITWDDWGGFYDHAVPPKVDENGYGIRVPGLLISPYARKGYIDHQTLSFDAYLKFVQDVFLSRQRLDPKTDGRPDTRPTVREDVPVLGDLMQEFDFTQPPRKPLVLSARTKKP
jgi:phospholipase C